MWIFYVNKELRDFWIRQNIPLEILKNETNPIIIATFTKTGKRFKLQLNRTYYLCQYFLYYGLQNQFGKIGDVRGYIYLGFVYVQFENHGLDYYIIFNNSGKLLKLTTTSQTQFSQWKSILAERCVQLNFNNDYTLMETIGAGQNSCVKKCMKNDGKQIFCVKIVRKRFVNSSEHQSQILNEIKCLQQMQNHPSILQLIQVYENEKSVMIVCEYYNGSELISKSSPFHNLTLIILRVIFFRLIDALSTLNYAGYIHRDIKPQNILFKSPLDPSYIVLIDLGLAIKKNEKKPPFPKCGTIGFTAPEILNYSSDKKMYNEKCDVFSLGITFFVIISLYGFNPFKSDSQFDTFNNNQIGRVTFPNFPVLPLSLIDLLKKMLLTKPKERISCQEALQHSFFSMQLLSNPTFVIPRKIVSKKSFGKNGKISVSSFSSSENLQNIDQQNQGTNPRPKAKSIFAEINHHRLANNSPLLKVQPYKMNQKNQKTSFEVSCHNSERIGTLNIGQLKRKINKK